MKKSEIFNQILNKVCEVCEVQADNVMSDVKTQAVVDARILVVQYCRLAGLANDDIALQVVKYQYNNEQPPLKFVLRKGKSVAYIYNEYHDRYIQSHAFREMSRDIDAFFRISEMESKK